MALVTRSPSPGINPIIASSPKRQFVPGMEKRSSSRYARRFSRSYTSCVSCRACCVAAEFCRLVNMGLMDRTDTSLIVTALCVCAGRVRGTALDRRRCRACKSICGPVAVRPAIREPLCTLQSWHNPKPEQPGTRAKHIGTVKRQFDGPIGQAGSRQAILKTIRYL